MIQSFIRYCKRFLSNPGFYHFSRQFLLLGMPLKKWAEYGNYFNSEERIADLGCGPADILRFLNKNQLPAFYLGIDTSDHYLYRAKQRAASIGLQAHFINLDLNSLADSYSVKMQLVKTLTDNTITTVNLFGVIHHLDDQAILNTLNIIYDCHTIKSLNTQDVLMIPGNAVNNFYASLDRGGFVRTENQYDALIHKSNWKNIEKRWTKAGVGKVKYIHYKLKK
jgi:SAM-dependent methyltransferase